MHGEIMKKAQIRYKSIFKYDDHQETINYHVKGFYEENAYLKKISFINEGKKIELIIQKQMITLINGNAKLLLKYQEKINNLYQTPYGEMEIITELITFHDFGNIKLKYRLYDNQEIISEVYLLVDYQLLENT